MFVFGLLNGPLDIALFTVRQRRTDPAWMGRAFAVSMAFNFLGFPIGAPIAGALATDSLALAVVVGAITCLLGAALAQWLVPATAPDAWVPIRRSPSRARHGDDDASRERDAPAGPPRLGSSIGWPRRSSRGLAQQVQRSADLSCTLGGGGQPVEDRVHRCSDPGQGPASPPTRPVAVTWASCRRH